MSRRHRRSGRSCRSGNSYRSAHRRYRSRRRCGWGMNLYRNTRDKYIAGVCAGLADHWGLEHWVVRIMAVAIFLFTGSLAMWAYVAGWILMAPRRETDDVPIDDIDGDAYEYVEMEYDEHQHGYRPRKIFRYSDSPSVRLQRARERLDGALRRVEDMETYVTSRQYNLNREFSQL